MVAAVSFLIVYFNNGINNNYHDIFCIIDITTPMIIVIVIFITIIIPILVVVKFNSTLTSSSM